VFGGDTGTIEVPAFDPANRTPVADAGPDRTVLTRTSVMLLGAGDDYFGEIVLYEWDFESDGIIDLSSDSATAMHVFSENGTYNATLRVTDSDGNVAHDTCVICAADGFPDDYSLWPNDSTDYVLTAYRLSAEQEALFSHEDGGLSAFWTLWDESQVILDRIHELPSIHGVSQSIDGFDGEDDCRLIVKAAWGEKGLYLLAEAVDDTFFIMEVNDCECSNCNGIYDYDILDMDIDVFSSDDQKRLDLFITDGDQRTSSYTQFKYRYGTTEHQSDIICINSFDSSWEGVGDPIQYRYVPIGKAFAMGILFEVIHINESRKIQEWLIPWEKVGSGMTKPELGRKIAFIAGYLDMDPGNTRLDFIRLKNHCDVYCNSDNWGDIVFGPELP
jgi:hypothetical protein